MMEKSLDNNGYIDFPFPASTNADGSVNPCGFDLTLETDRIDEITAGKHSENMRASAGRSESAGWLIHDAGLRLAAA